MISTKNSISSAVIGRLIGLDDSDVRNSFEKRFARRGAQALEYNLEALAVGHELADQAGLTADQGLYTIVSADCGPQMLITGNEAVAFGLLLAGGVSLPAIPLRLQPRSWSGW